MRLSPTQRARAQESRSAIERLYIAMRHLFIRGSYKPTGVSGEALINALMTLRPEIYGSITDPERVELNGLLYIFERLPQGIEECRFIKLISREGYENSNFKPMIASKRRRNAYRIDKEQLFIEVTRGRSDIYDILTHLTFMFVESEKIRRNITSKGKARREWQQLRKIVEKEQRGEEFNLEVAFTYLGAILGRTFDEITTAWKRFDSAKKVNSLFRITYWLGQLAWEEHEEEKDREIIFSSALREKVGHHVYGGKWAKDIKAYLYEHDLLQRPIHIISANTHSVMNCLFAQKALNKEQENITDLAEMLSQEENKRIRKQVVRYALENGMYQISDNSGTNLMVQVFDTNYINPADISREIPLSQSFKGKDAPVILVMDYAFGEQAFETIDELLKPYHGETSIPLNVQSISIMGKAGTLKGGKGDIMIPNAHIFEGTADNYPFENALTAADFEEVGQAICNGPMITVLGTSLQNRDVLRFFAQSSWNGIGLEMEGAHYQKAIQAASKIRKNIREDVVVRYAYYASDNPLISGQTLASGSLGLTGVYPTYLITKKILGQIL